MIVLYKDRKVEDGQEVQIYKNLHNDMYSIRCPFTRLVLAHGFDFLLKEAFPIVSEKGRQKVNKEQRKSVHAYVQGKIYTKTFLYKFYELDTLHYNPYITSQFMLWRNKISFDGGDLYFHKDSVKVGVTEEESRRIRFRGLT